MDDFSADAAARHRIETVAMETVKRIEIELGNTPKDVSQAKCGYDIESLVPLDKRGPNGTALRLIEVKGRSIGAKSVVVTKNEILRGLNKPDEFILAIVEVDLSAEQAGGESVKVTYLKKPFKERPDFAATGVIYEIKELISTSEIVLQRG